MYTAAPYLEDALALDVADHGGPQVLGVHGRVGVRFHVRRVVAAQVDDTFKKAKNC